MTIVPFDGHTRVVLADPVADISAPPIAVIQAGVDVTCDLTRDGLRVQRTTQTVDRTPWRGDLAVEAPTRVQAAVELVGYRRPSGEVLWPATSDFRAERLLVVRRILPFDEPWDVGQSVEAMAVRVGKRSVTPSATNAAVIFTVPLFVFEDDDSAVIAA